MDEVRGRLRRPVPILTSYLRVIDACPYPRPYTSLASRSFVYSRGAPLRSPWGRDWAYVHAYGACPCPWVVWMFWSALSSSLHQLVLYSIARRTTTTGNLDLGIDRGQMRIHRTRTDEESFAPLLICQPACNQA